jgi:hypothetical protein
MRRSTQHKAQSAQCEADRHERQLRTLKQEQQKLLHAFYRGSIDEELLAVEQERIDTERAEARRWADAATHDAVEVKEALDEALKLLADLHIRYRQADPGSRRIINQALFEKLLIRDDEIAEIKPSPWVIELHRAARSLLAAWRPDPPKKVPRTTTTPFRWPWV